MPVTSSKHFSFFVVIILIASFYSCNPDCESYASVNSIITPQNRLPGQKILVQTTPTDFLEGRELYIEKTRGGELFVDESTILESEYNPELKGRIATLPMDSEGVKNVYVADRDCGGFIPLTSVNAIDQSFIAANPGLFITPPRANIIIPTIPSISPTNIVNTWFSPDNRDYCIWIVPELVQQSSGCFAENTRILPGNRAVGPGTNTSGSWELSLGLANGCPNVVGPKSYHLNPVTEGVIDTLSGYVRLTIDRTLNGLPIETYEGSLLDVSSAGLSPDDSKLSGGNLPCFPVPSNTSAEKLIVLTSQTTGNQILIFRQNLVPDGFHGKTFCKPL